MNADDLKLLAEYMGYEKVVIAKDCHPHKVMKKIVCPERDRQTGEFIRDEYNPLKNNDQLVELIEKFQPCMEPHKNGWWVAIIDEGEEGFKGWFTGEAKELMDAVVEAAIKRVKA